MKRITIFYLLTLYIHLGLISQSFAQSGAIHEILSFQSKENNSSNIDQLYAESSALRRDLGLNISASYNNRFGEGFIEQDLSGGSVKSYYKTGISWDILKAGWRQNQKLAKMNDLKIEIETLNLVLRKKEESYFAQFALTAYLFDKEIQSIYEQRTQLLSSKRPLFASLKSEGYFTNKEILNLSSRLDEAQFEQHLLFQSNRAFELLFEEELRSFHTKKDFNKVLIPSIDISAILESYSTLEGQKRMVEMRKGLLKAPSYFINDVSFSISANYHYQTSFTKNVRDYASVGVSLKMPLAQNRKAITASYLAERKTLDEELGLEIKNRKKEVLMLYQEYAYKQKQLLNINSKLTETKEKLRVLNITKMSMNTDLPTIDASLLQDDELAIKVEQLGLKKQLHQLLLKVNLLLIDTEITAYLSYPVDRPIAQLKPEDK